MTSMERDHLAEMPALGPIREAESNLLAGGEPPDAEVSGRSHDRPVVRGDRDVPVSAKAPIDGESIHTPSPIQTATSQTVLPAHPPADPRVKGEEPPLGLALSGTLMLAIPIIPLAWWANAAADGNAGWLFVVLPLLLFTGMAIGLAFPQSAVKAMATVVVLVGVPSLLVLGARSGPSRPVPQYYPPSYEVPIQQPQPQEAQEPVVGGYGWADAYADARAGCLGEAVALNGVVTPQDEAFCDSYARALADENCTTDTCSYP